MRAAAWQIVGWYQRRWVIEQMHRVMKSQGLQLEDSQVTTAERLEKLEAASGQGGLHRYPTDAGARRQASVAGLGSVYRAGNGYRRGAGSNARRQHRAAKEPSPDSQSGAGELGRRPPRRLELLLQAARANHLPAGNGSLLPDPPRQDARVRTDARCENPLARKRGPSGMGPRSCGDDGVICGECGPSGVCRIMPQRHGMSRWPPDRQRHRQEDEPRLFDLGRLKGLAELCGVMRTVEAFRAGKVL